MVVEKDWKICSVQLKNVFQQNFDVHSSRSLLQASTDRIMTNSKILMGFQNISRMLTTLQWNKCNLIIKKDAAYRNLVNCFNQSCFSEPQLWYWLPQKQLLPIAWKLKWKNSSNYACFDRELFGERGEHNVLLHINSMHLIIQIPCNF